MRRHREWTDDARTVASTGLAVVATLLLVVGGITLYARETIFDADAFTDRAASTLRKDEVRAEVTRRIVDQIIDKGSAELLQAKPLLETVVDGALDTGAFRGLFRKAALNLHRLVFERDRSSLVFDLADAGTVVIAAAKAIAPSVAKEIPPDIEPALVNFGKRDWAAGTLELAEDVRFLGVVLPILAILLFAGSVAAAPDRRGAVGRVGAAVAVGAGLCVAVLLVGRSLALGAIEDERTRGAAGAAWDVFLGDLSTWALAVGAGGLVLAAAAHSVLQPFDVSGRAERLQDLVTRRPATKIRRVARAVAILAVSLFVVVQPTSFLRIVTIVVGAYGLFFATSELLAVVARPRRRPAPEEPEEPERHGPLAGRAARAAAAAAAVLAIGLVLLAVFSGGDERPSPHITVNCNGFRQLCDRPLNQVVFPATHNSMSAADEPGWFFGHHKGGISSQLEFGVRGFLIDAHYGVLDKRRNRVRTNLEGTNRQKLVAQLGEQGLQAAQRLVGRLGFGELEGEKRPYLCHALCELGATDMVRGLRQMRDFLDSHPDEVVIVFIEDYVTPADIARTFEESGLRRYAFAKARDEPWPTLRQMIASNRRVLVLLEKQVPGARFPWLTQGFEVTQETPYAFKTKQQMAAADSCRPNRGGPDAPLFQLNHWIERVNPSPGQSEDINSYWFLLPRARRCQRERGLLSNLVAVNFYDRGDLLGVANVLNGLPRDAVANRRLESRRPPQ